MEDHMFAREVVSPTSYSMDNCKHFLNLDVLVTIAARTPLRIPLMAKDSPETFGTSSISENVYGFALCRNEADSIPTQGKDLPPVDVFPSWARDAAL